MAQPPAAFPLPSDLDLVPSPEVDRTLVVAAWIGEAAGIGVNVDYTALFAALAWNGGVAERWLEGMGGLDLHPVLSSLGLKPDDREAVLAEAMGGSTPSPRSDVLSQSARQVLQEAATLARETGGGKAEGPPVVEERHLLGAFFFRNPPGHDIHLWRDWGLDRDSWRREFERFVEETAPDELPAWRSRVFGTQDEEGDGAPGVDASVLRSYRADASARRVLDIMEAGAMVGSPEGYLVRGEGESAAFSFDRMVTSGHLARALVAVASREADLAPLAEWWTGLVEAAEAPVGETRTPAEAFGPLPPVPEDEELSSGFDDDGEGAPDLPPEDSELGRRGLPLTHELWAVLTRARTLAREASGRETVSERHLLAVLLVETEPAGHDLLGAADAPFLQLRARCLTAWTRAHLGDDASAWRAYLVGRVPPTVARFDTDSADAGEDQLDVTRYATAFATLMVSEAVAPPLSIGVFGDWGSGKSFFMRLMRTESERLSAMDVYGSDGERLFHRNVVPILFNAWHYVDANLWASLVQAILQGLHDAMVGTRDERLLDEVLDRLELAQAAKAQAAEAVERARAELEARRREEEAARDAAEENAKELEEALKEDVGARIRQRVVEGLSLSGLADFAASYADLPEAEVEAIRKLEAAGERQLGELKEVVAEGKATLLRGRSTLDWLVRAPLSGRQVAALVGVVVAGGAVVWGLDELVRSQVPAITAAVAQVGAAAGMVVAWVRGHLRRVGEGLDHMERIRSRVEEEEAAVRAEHLRTVTEAEARVEAARHALEEKRAKLTEARDQLAEAERELRESGSVRRIARLVERRLEGRDYERHLGIVAAIRRDFETISRYMAQRVEQAEADPEIRSVDRIVLYIDDLDRCPTEKVVSVLEAIHLLLAFELFVVVVGVDIRWAARSLQERYPQHLRGSRFEVTGDGEGVSVVPEGASALDYLEKIFQVPFWLPPMDEDASRGMINALVPVAVEEAAAGEGRGGGDAGPDAREGGDGPAGGPDGPATGDPGAPEPEGAAAEDDGTQEGATGPTEGAEEAPEEEAARLLSITAAERKLMLHLASAVGKSPRRLKRFVNTYRILKASLNALDRARFDRGGREGGEFVPAMTLLALLTGAPRVAIDLFHALRTLDDTEPLSRLVELVGEAPETPERGYALEALRTYRDWADGEETAVAELRRWAPEVARFSFRSGRL